MFLSPKKDIKGPKIFLQKNKDLINAAHLIKQLQSMDANLHIEILSFIRNYIESFDRIQDRDEFETKLEELGLNPVLMVLTTLSQVFLSRFNSSSNRK
jgi:hypothetical protein